MDSTEAVLKLQGRFKVLAKSLAPGDPSLQDDLIQEMSLGVLERGGNGNLSFHEQNGHWAAIKYLKKEKRYTGRKGEYGEDKGGSSPSSEDLSCTPGAAWMGDN